MKLKKILSLALAGAMCVGLLAGCSSGTPDPTNTPDPPANPTGTEATAPVNEPAELTGTLKVSVWDITAAPIYPALIEGFVAANPGVTIDPIDIPAAGYGTKLSVMLNGGSDVDVFFVKDADTIYSIAGRGQMTDLSSYIARDGVDLSKYAGMDASLNIDGKQVALPYTNSYYALFYNKDIFDAADVDYPSNDMTWAEFEEGSHMLNRMPKWKKACLYVVLILVCAFTLLPLAWMLSASLKLDMDVFRIPIEWIPSNPAWSNYQRIWDQVPMLRFTFNTFKITVITTVIQVFTCSFAAYGFAKCRFRGRNLLFLIYVATIAVPWQVYMLPQYSMIQQFGLWTPMPPSFCSMPPTPSACSCSGSSAWASPTSCWRPPALTT